MDEQNCDHDDPSLGLMMAQAFLVSAASVAGMFGGMLVVGKTLEWNEARKDRKLIKAANEEK